MTTRPPCTSGTWSSVASRSAGAGVTRSTRTSTRSPGFITSDIFEGAPFPLRRAQVTVEKGISAVRPTRSTRARLPASSTWVTKPVTRRPSLRGSSFTSSASFSSAESVASSSSSAGVSTGSSASAGLGVCSPVWASEARSAT